MSLGNDTNNLMFSPSNLCFALTSLFKKPNKSPNSLSLYPLSPHLYSSNNPHKRKGKPERITKINERPQSMADSSFLLDSLYPFHYSFIARDNEALTKALQISISEPNTTINSPCSSISTSDSILNTIQWSDPTPPTETRPIKEVLAPTGRVAKRKSRATKRSQTTYITADPSNFRQMVQQVTGIRFEPGLVDAPLVKPEPQRMPVAMQQGCLLPTLDTSAHMLNQARQSVPVRVERAAAGFGLEPGMSFPTLESWGMIV